jgi:hypothetical protein
MAYLKNMFDYKISFQIKNDAFYISIKEPIIYKAKQNISASISILVFLVFHIMNPNFGTWLFLIILSIIAVSFLFSQNRIKITPSKRMVEILYRFSDTKRTYWPVEGNLQYETHYDENNKISEVFLISKTNTGIPSKDYISLASFPDLETFKKFQSTFNKTYPDLRIKEWN